MGVATAWQALNQEIVACRLCPRLVACREKFARTKKREFAQDEYWGRPVPGFGDPDARLVVVGLAPSAHGANRTGRPFTGDRSGAFLGRAFHAAGFANQPTSVARGDGLRYRDLYLTAAVRCVPPDNRPLPAERDHCRGYLERELRLLYRTRAYLALGEFAYDALIGVARSIYGNQVAKPPFRHGGCVPIGPGRPLLYASYHPSPQNTNTGRLTLPMFAELLVRIRESWNGSPSSGSREG